jgi:hypothetical protein
MAGEKEEGECSDDEVVEIPSLRNANLLSDITGRIDDTVTRNLNIDLINLKLEVFRTMANKNKIKKQQKHNIQIQQQHQQQKLTQISSISDTYSTSAVILKDHEGHVENNEEPSSDMEMENWETSRSSEEQEDIESHIEKLRGALRMENKEVDIESDEAAVTIKKEVIDMNVVLRERMAKLAQEAAASAIKVAAKAIECDNPVIDTIVDTITVGDETINPVSNPEITVAAIPLNLQNNAFTTVFYFEEGEKLDTFDLASNGKKIKRIKPNKSGAITNSHSNNSSSDITATFTYWHEQEQVKNRPDSTVVRVNPVVDEFTLSKRDSDITISNNNALIQPRLSTGTTKRSFSSIAASSSSSFSSISHDLTVEANIFTSQAGVDPLNDHSEFSKRISAINEEINHKNGLGIPSSEAQKRILSENIARLRAQMERVERLKDEAKHSELSHSNKGSTLVGASVPSFAPIESSSSIESTALSILTPIPVTHSLTRSSNSISDTGLGVKCSEDDSMNSGNGDKNYDISDNNSDGTSERSSSTSSDSTSDHSSLGDVTTTGNGDPLNISTSKTMRRNAGQMGEAGKELQSIMFESVGLLLELL